MAPATSTLTAETVDPGMYGSPGRAAWMDIDWVDHLRWVPVDGGSVNVCDFGGGAGMPIVLVHGLSGCWQNWLENIPSLGAARRVIAVDLPGFGASEMPSAEITVSRYAATVAAVCESLGLERVAVAGNSLGGFVAADLAIHHPDIVDRLVLVSAAGLSSRYIAGALPVKVMAARWATAVGAALNSRMGRVDPTVDPMFRRPRGRVLGSRLVFHRPRALAPELLAEMARGAGRPAFASAMKAVGSYDFRELVASIRCPTLIVWGANDLLVPVAAASEYERLIPGSRKVVFPGTGHCAMIERPAAFNALVDGFLAESPADQA